MVKVKATAKKVTNLKGIINQIVLFTKKERAHISEKKLIVGGVPMFPTQAINHSLVNLGQWDKSPFIKARFREWNFL